MQAWLRGPRPGSYEGFGILVKMYEYVLCNLPGSYILCLLHYSMLSASSQFFPVREDVARHGPIVHGPSWFRIRFEGGGEEGVRRFLRGFVLVLKCDNQAHPHASLEHIVFSNWFNVEGHVACKTCHGALWKMTQYSRTLNNACDG